MLVPAPDLKAALAAFNHAGARIVVIGGFAVIAHAHIRATRDVDFLIPEDLEAIAALVEAAETLDGRLESSGQVVTDQILATRDHIRMVTTAGIIDLLRGGVPPLDYELRDVQRPDDGQVTLVYGVAKR